MCYGRRNIIPHPQRAEHKHTLDTRAAAGWRERNKEGDTHDGDGWRRRSRREQRTGAAAGNRIRFTRERSVSIRSCNMQSTLRRTCSGFKTRRAARWCFGLGVPRPPPPLSSSYNEVYVCARFGRDPISASLSTPRCCFAAGSLRGLFCLFACAPSARKPCRPFVLFATGRVRVSRVAGRGVQSLAGALSAQLRRPRR